MILFRGFIGAILLGAVFIFSAFLFTGIEGQRNTEIRYPNRILTNAEYANAMEKAPIVYEAEYLRRVEGFISKKYPTTGESQSQNHISLINEYYNFVNTAISMLYLRIYIRNNEKGSIVDLVSREALDDMRNYSEMIYGVVKRLDLCQNYPSEYGDLKTEADYYFEKPLVLLRPENIALYYKIQKHLEFGEKQQTTMIIFDQCLIFTLNMSKLCAGEHLSASQDNPIVEKINKQIEISRQNVKQIVARQPNLAYEFVAIANQE